MNIKTENFCVKAGKAGKMLKSLANAYRLMILCRLHESECSVGELERLVGLNQSALSQHLARLRREGLVATRREAQTIFYRIVDPHVVKVIELLYSLYCGENTVKNKGRKS